MKLIQITNSKPESKNSTKLKRYGLFECPVCKEHVEKPLSQGKRNKSCGKKECRKATFTNTKADTSMYRKQPIISTLPYYGSISTYHNRIVNSKHIQLSSELQELREFINITYSDYATIREAYPKTPISIIAKDGSNIIDSKNYKFIASQDEQLTNDLFINQYQYCCRRLMYELNVSYAVVNNTIKKLISDYRIDNLITKYGTSLKTIILNKKEYHMIENRIKHNRVRESSSIVYLVESAGYVKIGITNDISKRLSSLRTSTPFEINLIDSWELGENIAYAIEQYIHSTYKEFNEKLEWFKLNNEQIINIKTMLDNSNELLLKISNDKNQKEQLRLKELKQKHQSMLEEKTKKYEKQKEDVRKLNEKAQIETIHEDIEKWDRSSQIEACTTHGMSKTEIYKAWQTMKKLYKVTESWEKFENFQKDIEEEFGELEKLANNNKELPRVYPVNTEELVGSNNYIIKRKCDHDIKSVVARRVAKIGKNDSIEAEYNSVTEAAKAVKGIASKISAVCKGTRKSHAGYGWKYLD